jgi:Carbohydrate binding domain (family 11)
MRNPRLGLLLFALGASLVAACEAVLDPIDVAAGCPDKPLRAPEEWAPAPTGALIDDFEDGDLWLIESEGRTGNWYHYPVMSTMVAGDASTTCVAHGKRSGHFVATGAGDPGSNWNASMVDPFTDVIPYDASKWSGFSFWIAAGATSEGAEMTVGVNTPGVLASGDYHRTFITLTRTWTRVSIRFEDLKQMGVGTPPVLPVPKERIVNFIFWPANPFDFWIDDFRFE